MRIYQMPNSKKKSCWLWLYQFFNNFRCFLITSFPNTTRHPFPHSPIHLLIHPDDAKKIYSPVNFYCEIFTHAPPPGASFSVSTSFLPTVFVDTVQVSRLVW